MDVAPVARMIGAQVHDRRMAEGLTQKQLADAAGVSERLVRSLEMGRAHGIGLEKLVAILSQVSLGLDLRNATAAVSLVSAASENGEKEYSALLRQSMCSWLDEKGEGDE